MLDAAGAPGGGEVEGGLAAVDGLSAGRVVEVVGPLHDVVGGFSKQGGTAIGDRDTIELGIQESLAGVVVAADSAERLLQSSLGVNPPAHE